MFIVMVVGSFYVGVNGLKEYILDFVYKSNKLFKKIQSTSTTYVVVSIERDYYGFLLYRLRIV